MTTKTAQGFPWRNIAQQLFFDRDESWQERVIKKDPPPEVYRILDHMHLNLVEYVKLKPFHPIVNGKLMPPIENMSIQFLNLPYRELVELAQHPEADVRLGLALRLGLEKRHEKPALLLAGDADVDVRYVLALNSLCPNVALSRLVRDPDVWVRRRVAYHGRLSRGDAKKLEHDEDEAVRVFIRYQLAEAVELH